MTKKTKPSSLRENLDINNDIVRENFLIWKWLDEKDFSNFLDSFWDKREDNKVILSKFLINNNIKLSQLWSIKINIDNIKNFVINKPDFSRDIQKKIAKLFLNNLYENWNKIEWFVEEFESRFCLIENFDKNDFDFKAIQIGVRWFSDKFDNVINGTTLSNEEIFKSLWLNMLWTFNNQDLSVQSLIQDILQFEVKDLVQYAKTRWEEVEKDMKETILPSSIISEFFDKVKDTEIEKLTIEKLQLDWTDEKQYKEINEKIWKKYIENFEKIWINKEFISVIKKLIENSFKFSQLNKKEQTILRNTLITDNIDIIWNKWANYTEFDQVEFQKFMQNLYDFNNEEIKFNVAWFWAINLKIKKSVKDWINPNFLDVENFKDMAALQPITFTINIDNQDEEIIKELEYEWNDNILRTNWIMETHLTKSGPLNIWNWYELDICGKHITKSQFDELLDCDSDTHKLDNLLEKFWLYDDLKDIEESVRKEMYNPQKIYDNIDENWFDDTSKGDHWYWPHWYRFGIFKEMLKKIDVKVIKRDLIFEWKDADILSQLYIMSWDKHTKEQDKQVKSILKDFNRSSSEALGWKEEWEQYANDVFKKIKSDFEDYVPDDGGEIISTPTETSITDCWEHLNEKWKKSFEKKLKELISNESDFYDIPIDDELTTILTNLKNKDNPLLDEENIDYDALEKKLGIKESDKIEKLDEEKFQEAWNSLSWDQDSKFQEWTRLYFDLWNSQLPPKDSTSYYCFEILHVWVTTFTLRAIWWELKTELEGEKYILNKTSEQIDLLKQGWNVYKVWSNEWKDWNACLNNINRAKIYDHTNVFGNNKDEIKLKWNKFVKTITDENWKDKEVEIKYFNKIEDCYDDSSDDKKSRWQWKRIYKYEVKNIDTNKWTVKVLSNFDDYDENWDHFKYKYERELPFEQFILLVEWKHLMWAHQEMQDELESKYKINDPGRLASKWIKHRVSIWSVINIFKNTKKAINDKLDAYKKEQDEVLDNCLFSREWLNLWGKAEGFFGALWLSKLSNACGELYHEHYTNRENRTRKKIEHYYKIFEAEPNYSEYFNSTLVHILNKTWYIWNLRDDERYKFAAAFLFMVKNEWPYPRVFSADIWKWKRVENFLWPEHKIKFQDFYKKKKIEIEQVKNLWYKSDVVLNLQEELNKMELQYIISVIDGRAPYGQDSNEYMLKSIRWLKFMNQLEDNFGGYFNKHEDTKKKLNTFWAAEEQYLRTIWAGRFNKALPSLERMCEKAKSPEEVFRVKWYLLWAMLMGIIKNNSTKDTINSFYDTARSMGFAAWSWIKDIDQQKKVQVLLDWITNWNFSKSTKFNMSDFELGKLKDWKYWFVKDFQSYWNGNWKNILGKLENISQKNKANIEDKSIMDLANDKKDPNNYIFKEFIENSRTNDYDKPNDEVGAIYVTQAPWSATSNIIKKFIPNKWFYTNLKKEEDKRDAITFWKNAKSIIPTEKTDKQTADDKFMLFFNRFDSTLTSSVTENIIRSLPLIREQKEKWNDKIAYYILWYMIKWNMHSRTGWSFPTDGEFEQVINNFVDFFYKNIEFFDESTINLAFKNNSDYIRAFHKNLLMFDWKQFKQYRMNNLKNNLWGEKSKYNDLIQLKLREINYINRNKENYIELTEDDSINKIVEDIWRDCNKYQVRPNVSISWNTGGYELDMSISKEDLTNRKQEMNALENKPIK